MNVKYYCFRLCKAKSSDFKHDLQVTPNNRELYTKVHQTRDYVILRFYKKEIAVKHETFLDNFKVTRI